MYFIQWKKALQKMLEKKNLFQPTEPELLDFFESGMSPAKAMEEIAQLNQ